MLWVWLMSLPACAQPPYARIIHPTPKAKLQFKILINGTHPSNPFLHVIGKHQHFLWKLLFWKLGAGGPKAKITWRAWTPGIYLQASENNRYQGLPLQAPKRKAWNLRWISFMHRTENYVPFFFFWKSFQDEKKYKTCFKLFLFLRDPNFLTTEH